MFQGSIVRKTTRQTVTISDRTKVRQFNRTKTQRNDTRETCPREAEAMGSGVRTTKTSEREETRRSSWMMRFAWSEGKGRTLSCNGARPPTSGGGVRLARLWLALARIWFSWRGFGIVRVAICSLHCHSGHTGRSLSDPGLRGVGAWAGSTPRSIPAGGGRSGWRAPAPP